MAGFYYALYRKKDNSLLASGSMKECADQMRRTIGSLYSTFTLIRKGKRKKYTLYQESLDTGEAVTYNG